MNEDLIFSPIRSEHIIDPFTHDPLLKKEKELQCHVNRITGRVFCDKKQKSANIRNIVSSIIFIIFIIMFFAFSIQIVVNDPETTDDILKVSLGEHSTILIGISILFGMFIASLTKKYKS